MKVAIIGCGAISQNHIDSLCLLKEEIVALCDIDTSKCEKAKERFGIDSRVYSSYIEMLDKEDIDVVHICTPHYLHSEMICATLDRNINCLCEKPIAISFEQLKDIEKSLAKTKAQFAICHQRRFENAIKTIKEIFKDDEIISANGNLSWCRNEAYYKQGEWRGKKATEGGGVMINQALHTLDLLTYFMGYPKTCIAHTYNDTLKNVIDVEESAFGIFEYEDGRRFTICGTNANNASHQVLVQFVGKKHTVSYVGEFIIVDNREVIESQNEYVSTGKVEWGSGHYTLFKEYYRCLRENVPFSTSYKEGSNTLKLILSMYESNGKKIEL